MRDRAWDEEDLFLALWNEEVGVGINTWETGRPMWTDATPADGVFTLTIPKTTAATASPPVPARRRAADRAARKATRKAAQKARRRNRR